MVPMYTYLITGPTTKICITASDTVAFTNGLQATTDLNHDRPVCLGTRELLADNNGYEVMPFPATFDGTEERRRRPDVGRVTHRIHH